MRSKQPTSVSDAYNASKKGEIKIGDRKVCDPYKVFVYLRICVNE